MNPQRSKAARFSEMYIYRFLRTLHPLHVGKMCSKVRNHNSTHESKYRIDIVTEGGNNFHSLSDLKNKREGCNKSESNKKSKPDENVVMDKEMQKNERIASKRTWGSCAHALRQIAMHPAKHMDVVLEISDDTVVLNDLSQDVRKEHLPLLKAMHSAGLKWAEKFLQEDASLIFRLGYHSVTSMRQLHLHVISQEFNSPHLKNKKHWNSFNTCFFHDSTDVIEEIQEHGEATLNEDETLLSMELRCHRCKSAHPNIPRLKSHIANCKAHHFLLLCKKMAD